MIDPQEQAALNQALELFHFAFRAFTLGPDAVLAEQGLQRVHHRILYFVGRYPDLSINDLLGILSVSNQALNAPLRRLLELHLIQARQDPQDRRIKRLRLTETGHQLEQRLSGSQREMMARVFAHHGAPSESAWREIMGTIADWQLPAVHRAPTPRAE